MSIQIAAGEAAHRALVSPPPAAGASRRPRWFVVRSHAHAERLAIYHLQRQGFEVYRPMAWVQTLKGTRAEAMFPRYIFVSVDLEADRWRAIFSTIGVKAMVCSGEKPLPVPDKIIDAIQAREHDGFIRIEPRATTADIVCPFVKGETVRAEMGGLGIEAVFVERIDAKRASILMKLFGRETRTTVHLAHLS